MSLGLKKQESKVGRAYWAGTLKEGPFVSSKSIKDTATNQDAALCRKKHIFLSFYPGKDYKDLLPLLPSSSC
jgi:hypothetical protein